MTTTTKIPFSQDDRRTIRATAMWMLVAGVAMTLSGIYAATQYAELFTHFSLLPISLLLIPLLVVIGTLGLGVIQLIGSRSFARVARDGEVAALTRGLSALTVIYVFQAIVMLLGVAMFAFMWLLPML